MRGETRQDREQASYQFCIRAGGLGYEIVKRVSPYKFAIRDTDDWRGVLLTAIVLPETFDYYTYRMFRGKKTFDLLIVQRHNAIVPVDVVDMRSGGKYFPGDKIDDLMREHIRRRNADEKALLLSQIIAGARDGKQALNAMSPRMRQRYLKEAQSYLRGRIGRPFAS